jgi:hypothetical protein
MNSNVDIVPLGFLDIYPAQGNGYPGTNFASSCTGTNFAGPGYDSVNNPALNDLKNDCPTLVDGIGYCQQQGKKVLLSLGGAPGTTDYQLTSTSDAEYMADFLWGAFGPLQTPNNWPRPFDDAATGTHEVDGFDFDIEVIQPGKNTALTNCRMLTGLFFRRTTILYLNDHATYELLPYWPGCEKIPDHGCSSMRCSGRSYG